MRALVYIMSVLWINDSLYCCTDSENDFITGSLTVSPGRIGLYWEVSGYNPQWIRTCYKSLKMRKITGKLIETLEIQTPEIKTPKIVRGYAHVILSWVFGDCSQQYYCKMA